MANQLKKITARAKQIRRAHPNMKWTAAIKKAGVDYRAGRIGAVKKKSSRQTGTSNRKADIDRKAKPPGKRKSRSGRIYTERRKNRSDKPGSLTGVNTSTLKSELKRQLKDKLANALLRKETATTRKAWNNARKQVMDIKSQLRKLES